MIPDTARVELERDTIRVITVFPRMPSTDFGENSLGDQRGRDQQRVAAPAGAVVVDTPEYVAGKILEAVRSEVHEQFMDARS